MPYCRKGNRKRERKDASCPCFWTAPGDGRVMRMKKTIFNNPILLEIGIILLLGMIPLLWFKPGCLITGTDVNYPLNPPLRFLDRLFCWFPQFQTGSDRSITFASLFSVGLQTLLYKSGIGLIGSEKASYVFWYFLCGLAMYFFISQIAGGRGTLKLITRLTAVTVYMVNFYQFFVWSRLQINITALILFPVFLGLIIRYSGRKSLWPEAIFIMAVVSLACCSTGVQPPLIGSLLVMVCSYLVFELLLVGGGLSTREELSKKAFLSLILLGGFALVGSFWLIPEANFVFQSGYHSSEVGTDVFKVNDLAGWSSKYSSFLNVFRNLGDVIWFDEWGGVFYYPLFQRYQSDAVLIFTGTLLAVTPVLSLFFLGRNRHVLYFSVLVLIGIFMSKGLHPPWGGVYGWMLRHVPGFWIYRAPWEKFGILQTFGCSALTGLSVGKISEIISRLDRGGTRVKKTLPVIFAGAFLALFLWYHYPVIQGRMFPGSMDKEYGYHQKFKLGYHIKFPEYVFSAADWINEKKTRFNVLLLPDDRTNVYDWGYGASTDFTLSLLKQGILFRQYGEGMAPPSPVEKVYGSLIDAIYRQEGGGASRLLKTLNVRYILQRNDFRHDFFGDYDSPEFIKHRLAVQEGIEPEASFGKWDIYQVADEYVLPHLYASSGTASFSGEIATVPPRPQSGYRDGTASGTIGEPAITFKRESPVKYLVRVKDAKSPFWLVFCENFHQQWRLYRRGESGDEFQEIVADYPGLGVKEAKHEMRFTPEDIRFLFAKPLSVRHEVVNGYGNGWYIEPEKLGLGDDFVLSIYFWPQSLFYLGLAISGLTLVGVTAYWVVNGWRRKPI